jgi:hypothetical protein
VSIGGRRKFDTLRRKRSKNAAVALQICFGCRRAPRIMIPDIDRTFFDYDSWPRRSASASQPVTCHGQTAGHSDSRLYLRECEFCDGPFDVHGSYVELPGAADPARRAPGTHRLKGKWHPESVSIATRRGTRVRVQRRDRFNSGTRERGSDSDRRRRAPFPSAPGEELRSSCARDRSRSFWQWANKPWKVN